MLGLTQSVAPDVAQSSPGAGTGIAGAVEAEELPAASAAAGPQLGGPMH